MKYFLIILITLSCFSCRKNTDPYPYTFFSIKNYDGTEVEDLAEYVEDNDTIAILEFLHDNPTVSIDTKDKYFGYSLLMWAVFNHRYEAFHCLLNQGADPNFVGEYKKETPLLQSFCYYGSSWDEDSYKIDTRYCKELLEKGADPNFGHAIHKAAGRNLEYVQNLIEYGADYNSTYDGQSPADKAIILCQPEIAEYLIIEKKALLYDRPFWKNWDVVADPKFAPSKKRILDYLKDHPEQLKYQKTKKIVKDSVQ